MRAALLATTILCIAGPKAFGQERNRLLNELNWLELQGVVPDSIQTVVLPAGTLEPHGVVNNGADNTVPVALAAQLAIRLNALIAPVVPYGVTTTLDEYPGTFAISPATFEEYVYEVMKGLAHNGFRNIIVINGHGPNGPPLRAAAERVWRETDARLLVTEWWSMTADITEALYGTQGGHAGNNETAAVLAIRPDLVHEDLYSGVDMTTPRGNGWTAYPFPSSILLYQEGQGYPDFDRQKAEQFFARVVERLETVINDVIQKWERAGL